MTGLTRRSSDHDEHATDHDLLIKLNTKMNSICELVHESHDQHKEFIDKIDNRCEGRLNIINSNNDKVLGKQMFKWLFGTIIFIIIGMFGLCGMTRIIAVKNELQITHNAVLIGANALAIELLIKDKE